MTETRPKYLAALQEKEEKLAAIIKQYDIHSNMAKRLRALGNYEIVIVCDDSGSMNTPLFKTEGTRWDQLYKIVKMIIEVGTIFDSNGIDIYFLNREPLPKVKDPHQIDETFKQKPKGYTPLVPTLQKLFYSPPTQHGHDKKLLIFIVTDGAPTDDNHDENTDELVDVLNDHRKIERTCVHFLICTEDEYYINFLYELDRTMINVDVTNEYEAEKRQILQKRGTDWQFSFGDYVVKALVGAIDPEMDALNE